VKAHSEIPEVPLCVDLDGTIIKTDLLYEGFCTLLKRHPAALFKLPAWLMEGKAGFKQHVAEEVEIEADMLPYDEALLARLRREKEHGRILVLVTSAHRKFAERVQSHLALFGEVHATEGGVNLSAENKKDRLVQRFGDHGFDYVGNSRHDIPVWAAARESWVVDAPPDVQRAAQGVGKVTEIFSKKHNDLVALAKAMRLHQWLKNILVFVPLIASHQIIDAAALVNTMIAFLAFGLCASGVYLLNDLLDLSADRHHPRKRKRAFASGDLQVRDGLILIPLLLAASALLSIVFLPIGFLVALTAYFLFTLAYSFWAKERAVIDVLFLTGLYTMRMIAGAAATAIELSFWLLAFSIFFFLSLALIKRYSEMLTIRQAGNTHIRGRGYSIDDMPLIHSMGTSSGYMAVLVLALYIHSPEVDYLYGEPKILWALCPLLLFWISRAWLKSFRGELPDDPVVFAAKDRCSQITGLLMAATLWLAAS
jgi:4-hydroxybenzoate polyprenyltransferase/phosphoserine phosphatase